MVSKEVIIHNPSGLHARPASDFVKAAQHFTSKITLHKVEPDAKIVNAKSIVMLLSQGLVCGTAIEIIADGEDENEALMQLVKLVEGGFGE